MQRPLFWILDLFCQKCLENTYEVRFVFTVYKVLRMELYTPYFRIVCLLNGLYHTVIGFCGYLKARGNILHGLVMEAVYSYFLFAHLFVEDRVLVYGYCMGPHAARCVL